MPTYSEIKRRLKIDIKRPEQTGLAYLTHFLQTSENGASKYFVEHAKKYALSIGEEGNNLTLKDPYFQAYLPIEWDIPFPPPKEPKFKFIDLFAGIGGFRLAFQNLGGKCVFTSEWNHYAQKTYEANFGEVPFGDITKIEANEIPDHDILIGGFPCQPFSIAGVSKKNALGRAHGFDDETQGTLFFDIVKILKEKKPKAFLLENVKNLVSHDKGNTFKVIQKKLHELGYKIHSEVLNGKYYVPQNRQRIVIVGFLKEVFHEKEKFKFPTMPEQQKVIEDILDPNPEPKYTLTNNLWAYLQNYAQKHREKGNGFGFGLTPFDGIARTLSARYYKDGSEILIPQDGKNPRRLTPRECARLQGYPDNFIIPVSDMQAYKQFGNSVVVPLMQAIGENIVQELTFLKNDKSTLRLLPRS